MPRGVSSGGGSARRPTMPGADELFRSTSASTSTAPEPVAPSEEPVKPAASGRVKHDEKITVYVTADELLALEQARLTVRAVVGRNVDRGRIVRAALAASLEDLEARGGESDLVRRIEGLPENR
ncbi:hypothetical protein [Aeromicrobium sp. Sec7.5]|uniref:hypothetical protein n=1 Tax=Aeromicrobium sp. Sec7.5 TaxID=3121276 RepID=UPI002FE4DE8E